MSGNSVKIDVGAQKLYHKQEKVKLKLLCFDITKYSQNVQFVICTFAVFVFFILYGYMQELIFTIDGFKPFGWYLTLIQFLFYTLFGLTEKYFQGVTERKIPIKTYAFLALLTLGTMGCSNASLGYLNYPTQVIFKCCKLIPVMVGGILIQKKWYGPLDFIAACLMCVGLILFILADSMVMPNFNMTGVVIISHALLCDAIIGNVQERSMKLHGATNVEVVLYSYSIGFVYLFAIMFGSGNLFQGYLFFSEDSLVKYGYAFVFSLTGYLGIQIVLTLVRTCGAFVAVTVTTCRKAVTIMLSFMFFSKPFVFQYLTSGLLVVAGIYLNMYSKRNPITGNEMCRKLKDVIHLIKRRRAARQFSKFVTEL